MPLSILQIAYSLESQTSFMERNLKIGEYTSFIPSQASVPFFLLIRDYLSLFLNVFKPANATLQAVLPVKVWLHGGGNTADSASNPLYDGCYLADDAIIVTINYRLGPLGYLALKAAGLDGNYGIQDQLLALQWIQHNIAAFGGDPRSVLLFGESAGAYDAFVLSTLPQASSLFSAVVTESGGGGDLPSISQVQNYHTRIVKAFGCESSDISCIRRLNATAMNNTLISEAMKTVTVAVSLLTNERTGISWSPVVDGETIPGQPVKIATQVPAIVGSNGHEGTIFWLPSGVPFAGFNQTMYDTFIEYNFGPWNESVKVQYPVSAFSAAQYPTFQAMSTIITDFYFKCPAYRALKGAADKNVTVFSYRFNHTPGCSWLPGIPQDKQLLGALGATHLAEIPFVFGVKNNLPPPTGNCSFTPQEVSISDFMVKAWTSMASRQVPGPETIWPAWIPKKSEGVIFDGIPSVGYQDYKACNFWDPVTADIFALAQNGHPE
jgi:carboxylesterase type B